MRVQAAGAFLSTTAHPRAVVLHRDHHVMPSGLLAGRPSLLAYTGWMTSHGYNFGERDRDRTHVLTHALRDADARAEAALRRWGVSYVVGEWIPRAPRASESAALEAAAEWRGLTPEERAARGEMQWRREAGGAAAVLLLCG